MSSNQEKKLLFMYALESLHAGAGSSTGTIDNPIQRERHTQLPKIEGSTNRGAAREASWGKYMSTNNAKAVEFTKYYGYKDKGDIHSAVEITDAQLLFFPVRSWKGVFAWITSPYVLTKFAQDYNRLFDKEIKISGLENITDNKVIILNKDKIAINQDKSLKVLFEEYLFEAEEKNNISFDNKKLGAWIKERFSNNDNAIIDLFPEHLAIVSNDVFKDFTELYTHKITRNAIDSDTGTAKGTGLFNEEYLPPESILYAQVIANDEFVKENGIKAAKVIEFVEKYLPPVYKIGGNQSVGKGLVQVSFYPPATQNITNQNTNSNTE
jgi:CRISPR-associated protein Cmr4